MLFQKICEEQMNKYERLFKLWTAICKMVVDEIRDPDKLEKALEVVLGALQSIVDEPVTVAKKAVVYLRRLFETETIKLGGAVFAVYEIVVDGTFTQIFGSLGDPNRLC